MFKLVLMALLVMSLQADMFSQGSKSVGVKLGSASIGNESYFIGGVSGNYFVLDNLSVGLGYEKWFSGSPDIDKLTIESTYFLGVTEKVHPYAGILYRRILVNGEDRLGRSYDDTNAYGGRAGISFVQGNLLLSAGVVHEVYDGAENLFGDSQTYLEILVGFAF